MNPGGNVTQPGFGTNAVLDHVAGGWFTDLSSTVTSYQVFAPPVRDRSPRRRLRHRRPPVPSAESTVGSVRQSIPEPGTQGRGPGFAQRLLLVMHGERLVTAGDKLAAAGWLVRTPQPVRRKGAASPTNTSPPICTGRASTPARAHRRSAPQATTYRRSGGSAAVSTPAAYPEHSRNQQPGTVCRSLLRHTVTMLRSGSALSGRVYGLPVESFKFAVPASAHV